MTEATEQSVNTTSEQSGSHHHRFLGGVSVPLAFLGLGVYRAWIEIAFVGPSLGIPLLTASARDLFDWVMVFTATGCFLLARKIGPFYNKRSIYLLSGITLTISTIILFSSSWVTFPLPFMAQAAALCGGFGIGIMILIWSELYACLNPLRVALYYSASIIAGALLIYIYRGFMPPWLFVMTSILPAASLLMAKQGFASLPPTELPATAWTRFSVPWKAVLFMGVYAFGYGLMESGMYQGVFGPHSAPGTIFVGLLVFLGVAFRQGRFDFSLIYRVALPLIVIALFLVPTFGNVPGPVASFCMSSAYTAQSILIMLIMANICYRYGVSAIWLFGIERSVRQITMWLGRAVGDVVETTSLFGDTGHLIVSFLAIVAVIFATTILLSERDLSSRWGANFLAGGTDSAAMIRKQELADRCREIAHRYKLSPREEEVLLLLAQHKTVGIIERELFIANGTAKAHVRHVYQKLDIHTRSELFNMIGVESRDEDAPV
ncbi:helix-turn-helix transcriptional regulator [Adlercreutzia agrestimuris]|uniref:helix-turn-helix transcriptional regulator n=1 Tax=Adlercreutzia agrestimuris TaxID=2941324 RepID=UPI00203BA218|nr:LuxR C-terminal-related transcriptional regulator [Adlercreutzia agrestimuris]